MSKSGWSLLFSEHLNSLLPNRTAPYGCQRQSSASSVCKEEPDHYYKKVSAWHPGHLGSVGGREAAGGRIQTFSVWLFVLPGPASLFSPVSVPKLYEDLVIENEKLKEQLQEAQLQLTQIKLELERVTQVWRTGGERRALERKAAELEEELKALSDLKADNQRLKDENAALIRVISKLSK
uniref:cGMP-dependent protein kinase interacting domain-containing protein n=1 Tax=Varanus komodoensis TaxID=61221 RepID=A0A8D2Q6E6_VARKO